MTSSSQVPGPYTSEYRLTKYSLLAAVVLIVTGLILGSGFTNDLALHSTGVTLIVTGAGMLGVSTAGYSISRGLAKKP